MAKTQFKFEKQHKENPKVCKNCGKVKDFIVEGLCEQCTKTLVQENVQKTQKRYWTLNEKEAKEMNVK
jgi:hypothetical protein